MIRHSWRTHLKAAVREEDVLLVVHRFLSEWQKAEIAQLPAQAWPAQASGRAGVLSHAALLAGLHARFEGDAAQLQALQEMLLFFTHAAVRMARIGAVAAADPPGGARAADPPRRVRTTAARKRTSNGRRAGAGRRG